jgi:hypothetical protein
MARSLSDSATRLPAPVTVERDYSRHPIPGQLALFPPAFYTPRADGGQWLAAMWARECPRAAETCNPTSPF